MKSLLSFFTKKEEKSTLPAEIQAFKIFGSLFRREEKASKMLMEDALIQLEEGEKKYDFVIHVSKDEENFYFPISTKMDLREQTAQDGDKIIRKYVFDLEGKLKMRLEFDVTLANDMKEVLLFEKYISQLVCLNSLQRDLRDDDSDRVRSACRHIVGKDTGRGSETTSQRDSDVFSIMSAKSEQTNTSSASSDMNRLAKDLGGLEIDGTKRNVEFKLIEKKKQYPDLKDLLAQKEREKREAEEAKLTQQKFHEDRIILNQNNLKLQNAMRTILDMKDIKVAQIGCMFEAVGNMMVLKYQGIIFAIKSLDGFDFKMLIFNDENQVIHQHSFEIGSTWEANSADNNLRWIEEKSGHQILYQISFDVPASSSNVFTTLQQCHFERVNQITIQKAFKEEEIKQHARYVLADFDPEEYAEQNKDYFPEENYLDMTFNPNSASAQGDSVTKSSLRSISQARVLDRTFLSKGENIEVYRTDVDDGLSMQYLLSFPIVKGLDGNIFEPKKMLLQDQDTKMLLLNNQENNKVFYFDIEKGKVVQELGADEFLANSIRDFCNESKLGALDHSQTFYSINSKNIFRMDPREAKGNPVACVTTNKKEYTVNNKFTCISTTINGEFAIGSADGTVRLYNEVSKNAKNSFNLGFGDPIIGLDISKDSKWILATCDTYLILFPTYDQSNGEKNAFTATVKITDRPNPIRIQLTAQDQYQLNLKQVGFTPAKFDSTLSRKEKHIVTSTGIFTIVWDFAKVLKGKKACYEIKKSDEEIVSTEFKFNQQDNVLAASSSRLEMQNIVKRYD